MYNLVIRTILRLLTPWFLRGAKYMRLMYSIGKPLQTLNNNGVIITDFDQAGASLFQHNQFINRFVACDARTMYLEKWLNLYWDMPDEGIVINNNNALSIHYLFNTVEAADPVYFFNDWDASISYTASPPEYAVYEGYVYVCISNSTGDQPDISSSKWAVLDELEYHFQSGESSGYDFTVEVPLAVTMQSGYSTEKITKHVKNFSAAGRTFNIRVI